MRLRSDIQERAVAGEDDVVVLSVRRRRSAPRRGLGAVRLVTLLAREARPPVQLLFLLRIVVAVVMGGRPWQGRALLLVVSWQALACAVYVFNGTTDIDGDQVNCSRRPIASGELRVGTAQAAVAALATAGLAGSTVMGPSTAAFASAFLVLGWAYSAGPALKRRAVGSAVVIGTGCLLTYAAGWSLAPSNGPGLLVGVAISAWVAAACGVKDFSDVEGDRAAGRRTLPVVLGRRGAVVVLTCLAGGTSAALLAMATRHVALLPSALTLLLGSVAVVAALARRYRVAATAAGSIRRAYRLFLGTQYAANVAAILGVLM